MKITHITESTDLGSGFQDPDKSGKKLKIQKMRELVERAKHVRANSKKPKIVKPNTGHESPHPYDNAGFVGEADLDEISMQDIKKGAQVAAVTGAIALGGAGIGKVGDYMNQSSFDYSIQLPQLEMYLDYAEAQRDQRMIKQLKTRIRNHEGRLSMGGGDLDGRDGTPLTFEVVYDKENPNFDPLGDPMMLNKKFKDARDNMPEGIKKAGLPSKNINEGEERSDIRNLLIVKVKDYLQTKSPGSYISLEDMESDLYDYASHLDHDDLDSPQELRDFMHNPGEEASSAVTELLSGMYHSEFDDYITTEGKSPHKKGTAKYKKHMAAMHAEGKKKPELPKQNNPVAKHSRNKSGAGAHIDKKKEAKKRGDFSPIDEAQYSADKAALLSAVLNELEKEVMDADNTRMLRRLARIIGKKVFRRENGQLTLEDKE